MQYNKCIECKNKNKSPICRQYVIEALLAIQNVKHLANTALKRNKFSKDIQILVDFKCEGFKNNNTEAEYNAE